MSPCRLLVVGDDLDFERAIRGRLNGHGFDIVGGGPPSRAIHWLRNARPRPHAILLALWLPILDGLAFREEHALDPELARIPVLVVPAVDEQLLGQVVATVAART